MIGIPNTDDIINILQMKDDLKVANQRIATLEAALNAVIVWADMREAYDEERPNDVSLDDMLGEEAAAIFAARSALNE